VCEREVLVHAKIQGNQRTGERKLTDPMIGDEFPILFGQPDVEETDPFLELDAER
jgi:hypothetical protein